MQRGEIFTRKQLDEATNDGFNLGEETAAGAFVLELGVRLLLLRVNLKARDELGYLVEELLVVATLDQHVHQILNANKPVLTEHVLNNGVVVQRLRSRVLFLTRLGNRHIRLLVNEGRDRLRRRGAVVDVRVALADQIQVLSRRGNDAAVAVSEDAQLRKRLAHLGQLGVAVIPGNQDAGGLGRNSVLDRLLLSHQDHVLLVHARLSSLAEKGVTVDGGDQLRLRLTKLSELLDSSRSLGIGDEITIASLKNDLGDSDSLAFILRLQILLEHHLLKLGNTEVSSREFTSGGRIIFFPLVVHFCTEPTVSEIVCSMQQHI